MSYVELRPCLNVNGTWSEVRESSSTPAFQRNWK